MALALLLLVASLVIAVVVVVRGLDQPWLKRRVQTLVGSNAGVDLDYRATQVALSGLRIEGLVVLSPESFRPLAPELARVGALEARWTLASLRGGAGR